MKKEPQNKFLWTFAILLCLIGVFIVIRRFVILIPVLRIPPEPATFSGNPDSPDDGFFRHPWMTVIHILPGFLFATLGLLQFRKSIRVRWPDLHRWIGRVAVVSGLIIGSSGILMGFKLSVGGISETGATTLFGSLFLFSLIKAYLYVRQKHFLLHRQWMIRAYAIGMAVTTTRPIVGFFFATSPLTGLAFRDFFGTALWIGFTLHLIAAEAWINHTRQTSLHEAP